MGALVQLPWAGDQALAPELGACDWCRTVPAVDEVQVTPAKHKGTTRQLLPHERAVVVAACADCAAKLRRQLERRDREREALRERRAEARVTERVAREVGR